jgi:hypothetical protein
MKYAKFLRTLERRGTQSGNGSTNKSTAEVAPVQAIKAYRGNRGTAPLIFNLGTRWKFSG